MKYCVASSLKNGNFEPIQYFYMKTSLLLFTSSPPACTLMANTSPLRSSLMHQGAHLRPLESLSLPLSAHSGPTKLKYFRFGAIKSLHRFKIMVLKRHNRFSASKLSFKGRQNCFIASKRRTLKQDNRCIPSKRGFSSNTIASLLQKEGV